MKTSLCRICDSSSLEEIEEFAALHQVTSDCRPWPGGGHLVACHSCGTVQKPHDERWASDCRAIYSDYELYSQSSGIEQAVFEADSGMATTRSEQLLQRIAECVSIPRSGQLLDIGCGNGSFLRVFGSHAPQWKLWGSELHSRYRQEIEKIPGVERFHHGPAEELPGDFDWIVLLHVLEHVPNPVQYLDQLRSKLRPNGTLVIEVPHHIQNPFELTIADHACHFSSVVLQRILTRARYAVESFADHWIPRELSALARATDVRESVGSPVDEVSAAASIVRSRVRWLADAADLARQSADQAGCPIGVFGSSIAATWITTELDSSVAFFVDEDPSRVGRTHLGHPILTPKRAPTDVPIYLALPRAQAETIALRLQTQNPSLNLILPPEWNEEEP